MKLETVAVADVTRDADLGARPQMPRSETDTKRDRILDAAEICFVRGGLHRTKMQDIGEQARMSHGNIYRYFNSKDAVIQALGDRHAMRAADVLEQLGQSNDRRTLLLGVIERYFARCSRDLAVLRIDLLSEVTRDPSIAKRERNNHSILQQWLVEMLTAQATVAHCDIPLIARQLHALLNGMVVQRALLDDFDADAAMEMVTAFLDAALHGRDR